VTYGCIDSSSISDIEGNYTQYLVWNNHSIWIQQVESGAAYVIYFSETIGNSEYQGFGIYLCDSAKVYIDTVEQMSQKSPENLMSDAGGCAGVPDIFCPALDVDDASTLMDGMGASDGSLDWIYIKHFYSCIGGWFDYNENENYPTTASLSFIQSTWCEQDTNNDGSIGGGNVKPGDKTNIGTTTEEKPKMSSTAKGILWTCVTIFILFCIAAISYFVYKHRQKKLESAEQNVGLTDEKEENKFSTNEDPLGIDEDNTTKDVAV